jgi:serine/threonine protein kinase/MFS family permease
VTQASVPPDSSIDRPQVANETWTLDQGSQTLEQLADLVEQFINSWETTSTPPEIAPLLPPSGPLRLVALNEIIKVDLEYRWQCGQAKRLHQYVREFPELAVPHVPHDLIYEEFHVRSQAGDTVLPDDYLAEFPEQADALRKMFGQNLAPGGTVPLVGQKRRHMDDLEPGITLDDFDLVARLGQGAFGQVFLARQRSMERLVALKVSAQRSSEPQALAQLDHDSIVRVFDLRVLSDRGLQLLYMQYVAGGTLSQVIDRLEQTPIDQRNGSVLLAALTEQLEARGGERPSGEVRRRFQAMSWPEAVCWLGQRLALALDYAHHRGVLHRDVKPANILLSAEGVPKLADFNISFAAGVSGATPEAYFGGSLAYMSPEQLEACHIRMARKPEELDQRSDLYSLAVVLWELLTGKRPFGPEQVSNNWEHTLDAMLATRRQGVVDEARCDMPGRCPEGLLRLLERCLAFDANERPSTGAELAQELILCRDHKLQRMIDPPRSRVLWYAWLVLPAVFVMTFLPNAAAGAFNYFYNESQIIRHQPPGVQEQFHALVGIINGIAYPLGCLVIGWRAVLLGWRLNIVQKRRNAEGFDLRQLRHWCLGLAQFTTAIALSLWCIAGIAYPLILQILHQPERLSSDVHAHFFTSLILCGLIGTAYPFFLITAYSLRGLYLPTLSLGFPREDAPLWQQLQRQLWIFLVMAAVVPLLGGTLLGLRGQIDSAGQLSLFILSVSGLVGVAMVFALFKPLMNDLDTLLAAARRIQSLTDRDGDQDEREIAIASDTRLPVE